MHLRGSRVSASSNQRRRGQSASEKSAKLTDVRQRADQHEHCDREHCRPKPSRGGPTQEKRAGCGGDGLGHHQLASSAQRAEKRPETSSTPAGTSRQPAAAHPSRVLVGLGSDPSSRTHASREGAHSLWTRHPSGGTSEKTFLPATPLSGDGRVWFVSKKTFARPPRRVHRKRLRRSSRAGACPRPGLWIRSSKNL